MGIYGLRYGPIQLFEMGACDRNTNCDTLAVDSNRLLLSDSVGLSRPLTLTLKNPPEPIAALSAVKSSSWLAVDIQLSGNNRVLMNSANISGLQSGVYSDTVTLVGPGIWGMKYAVTLQVGGSPALASIRITPSRPSVYPGDTVHFSAAGYDQFGVRLAAQPAFAWTGTTGSGNGTFIAGAVSPTPYAVTASAGGVLGSTNVSVITFNTIHVDIDTTQYRGVFNASKGTCRITGTPDADIWASDQFFLAYVPVTGDFDVSVKLDSVYGMATYSKPGLMFRDELTPWCRFTDFYYQRDGSYGWLTVQHPGHFDCLFGPTVLPCWMRFARTGTVVNSYLSADGENWTRVSGRDIVASGEDYIGLYCAGNSATPTAVFSDLRGFYGSPPVSAPPALSVPPVPNAGRGPYRLQVFQINGRFVKECEISGIARLRPAFAEAGMASGVYYTIVRSRDERVVRDGTLARTRDPTGGR
jgi:hypothetical protein